ncbi:MAG: hypothetical protein ACYDAO_07025 [Thermoplasmataceae archaeon]
MRMRSRKELLSTLPPERRRKFKRDEKIILAIMGISSFTGEFIVEIMKFNFYDAILITPAITILGLFLFRLFRQNFGDLNPMRIHVFFQRRNL